MMRFEPNFRVTWWVIVTTLASTTTLAAGYRQPNFAIPIDDDSGRVTNARDRVHLDPLNQVQPIVSEILFLDSHRSLVFFSESGANPELVMTNYARREVNRIKLDELKPYYPRRALLAGFRVGRDTGLTAVAVQVERDEGVARVAYTTTYVLVCVFDREGLISRSAPVEVEHRDYTSSDGMPNPTWYFLTSDSIESGRRKAGVISYGRIFLRENRDGYTDLVLWRRNLSSLPDGAPETPTYGVIDRYFEPKPDDARVMSFDPVSRTFSVPRPAEGLAPPAEELWEAVPPRP